MKILFTSDWHLGLRQYGSDWREQVVYDSANFIVDYAIANNITYIVNAGDVFNVKNPTSTAVGELKKIHYKLVDNNITMLTSMGNHDFLDIPWTDIISDKNTKYGVKSIDGDIYTLSETNENIYFVKGYTREDLITGLNTEIAKTAKYIAVHTRAKEFATINMPTLNAFSFETDYPYDNLNAKIVVSGDIHVTEEYDNKGVKFISPGSIEMVKYNEPLDKYVWVYDTDTEDLTAVTIIPNYVRVRSDKIRSEEQLTEFLNMIVKSDVLKTELKCIVYIVISPTVPNYTTRVNQIISSINPDTTIRFIPLIKRLHITEEDKKNSLSSDEDAKNDDIMSIDAYFEKILHSASVDYIAFSENGKKLIRDCIRMRNESSDESVATYITNSITK